MSSVFKSFRPCYPAIRIEQVGSSTVQLELLGTSGCHLCDDAETVINRIAPVLGYKTQYIDIAEDDTLVEKYGMQIPVLRSTNQHELHWPFDEQKLIQWLDSLPKE